MNSPVSFHFACCIDLDLRRAHVRVPNDLRILAWTIARVQSELDGEGAPISYWQSLTAAALIEIKQLTVNCSASIDHSARPRDRSDRQSSARFRECPAVSLCRLSECALPDRREQAR
jgi:hypothetical protein